MSSYKLDKNISGGQLQLGWANQYNVGIVDISLVHTPWSK